MLFISILAMRTKRVLLCLKRVLPSALAVTACLMALVTVIMYVSKAQDALPLPYIIKMIAAIFMASWFVLFVYDALKYRGSIFHKYDEDIIGTAFTGLDRKSAVFEKGLEVFRDKYFGSALEIFTELDDERFNLTEQEKGVLCFYRGRCYDLMDWKPNAENCYEKAQKLGFMIPEMPVFLARCYAENGSTEKALSMFTELMDTDKKYSDHMRVEIGRMYLRYDEGETALKWFSEAIEKHQCYADALGGAAIAYTIMGNVEEGEKYYRMALLNNIGDPQGFSRYYKEIQAAVLLKSSGG